MENQDNYYNLRKYSANYIFEHSNFEDGIVKLHDQEEPNALISIDAKKNCQLFDQSEKEFFGIDPKEKELMYILIDFHNFSHWDKFKKYPNGIEMEINNHRPTYVMFLKSNSMSKNCTILYVNKDYFPYINNRVNFGYDQVENLRLAKWFAYSGLALSDADFVHGIDLNMNNVCIVKDLNVTVEADHVITAISMTLLIDMIEQFKKGNKEAKERITKEFDCFKKSKDFNNLANKELILKCIEYIKNPANENLFNEIIAKYRPIIEAEETIPWEKISLNNYPMDINMFDGEGLIDLDAANKINNDLLNADRSFLDEDSDEEYEESGVSNSFQIRLPFVKGVVHACNFKQFFKDNNIKEIQGIGYSNINKTITYKVDDLVLILTESQFKASTILKEILLAHPERNCLEDYFNFLNDYDYTLGISGRVPNDDDNVKLCYQFLSTLPLDENAFNSLMEYNKDYLNNRCDISYMVSDMERSKNCKDKSYSYAYNLNKKFALGFSYLKDKRSDLFQEIKDDFKIGQIKCKGMRKYLSSDLLALLYHAAGLDYKKYILAKDKFYIPGSTLHNNNQYVLLRNPHYSRNEIVTLSLDSENIRNKYFSHLTGVVMLNPESFASERLGGADYDGDTVIILQNSDVINACKSNLFKDNKYIYPVVKIPSVKTKTNTTAKLDDELAEEEKLTINNAKKVQCLSDTFDNHTGYISNIAFTHALDAYKDDSDEEKSEDIAFYTIIGGLEIDSAKSGKKPDISKVEEGYTSPDFIKIKGYEKTDKLLTTKKETISDVKKRYLNANSGDFVNRNYVAMSKLRNSNKEFKKVSLRYQSYVDINKIKRVLIHYQTICYIYDALEDLRKQRKSDLKSLENNIIKEISNIIKDNGYELTQTTAFINKFNTQDPYKTFTNYCKDEVKYHFLTKEDDKLQYLEKYGFNLNNFEKGVITNFNNNGYKLLYLILYLNKIPQLRINIKYDNLKNNENPFIKVKDNVIDLFNKEQINEIREKIATNLKEIEPILHVNKSITDIKEELEEIMHLKDKDITIYDLNTVFDIFNNDLSFSVYFDPIKRYLREAK